jgi:hypothetical protein
MGSRGQLLIEQLGLKTAGAGRLELMKYFVNHACLTALSRDLSRWVRVNLNSFVIAMMPSVSVQARGGLEFICVLSIIFDQL